MKYLVTCALKNGNVIPAFTDTFTTAMTTAIMFKKGKYTAKVVIVNISTGATTHVVF